MKKKQRYYNITRYIADALAIMVAYIVVVFVQYGNTNTGFSFLFLSFSIFFWYLLSQFSKLYADRRSNKFSEEIVFIAYNTLLLSILLSSTLFFIDINPPYTVGFFCTYLMYIFIAISAAKYVLRKSIHAALHQGKLYDKILLVGSTPAAINYYETINKYYYYGYECVGLIDEQPAKINGCKYYGKIEALDSVLNTEPIDEVVIALHNSDYSNIQRCMEVCDYHRTKVRILPDLQQFNSVKGVEFFNHDQHISKIQSDWFKKFLNSVRGGQTSIIVTWTNKQTDIYNQTIRQHIFRGKKIQKFEEHDILMLSEFYGLDLGEDFVKQKLYTSEQIKVVSAKLTESPMKSFEMIINQGIKRMKQGLKLEGSIKELIDGLNEVYCKDTIFITWVLKVHKFGEDSSHHMTLIVIDDTDINNITKFNKYKEESSKAIKSFAKNLLHQFRTTPKQVEKNIIKPLWKQWNKIFVEPYAVVNYGYSITCHKAQGSSFYDVFVDLDDILLNTQRPIEARKCAYTATTRASNELNILV
jgi:hypothetical protein